VKSASRITSSSTQPRRVAAEEAEGDAEDDADADRDHADGDRDARADDEQREDVSAELVGAQPVGRRGALQLVRDVELGGGVRRPDEREERCQHHRRHEHPADRQARRAAARPVHRGDRQRLPCDRVHAERFRSRGSTTT
jgi:hypothetical protein